VSHRICTATGVDTAARRPQGVRVLGMPLRQFLRQRQLFYAEHLLRATSYPVEQIALLAAFGTRQAFYRAFKNAYGMTPGRYRNKVPKRT
jgi:AraC family transcriptional regulator